MKSDAVKREQERAAKATERNNPPFLLPCPICNGVEGCDHAVLERAKAASGRRQ